jgi:glycosyltransferase involved in cell wall biosynthesis
MENKKTLALVMIVKDEEKGLRAAIKSARPYVDEVVVAVDMDSSDDTEKIALECADVVKKFVFNDDYSDARNMADDYVKADYILFLDGHEKLTKCENLQKYLNADKDVILTSIKMESGMIFAGGRIYRNGCQFVGRIHEKVEAMTSIQAPDILITHDRVSGQDPVAVAARGAQRDRHMTEIMAKELEDDPKNLRSLFHLVLFYQSKDDMKNAKKYLKKYLAYSNEPGGRWYVLYNLALMHYTKHHYFRALMATRDAMRENPTRWEVAYLRGLIFFDMHKWREAMTSFVESMNENSGVIDFLPLPRNLGATFNFIGECLFQLKRYFDASESFRHAATKTDEPMFKDLLIRRATLLAEIAKKSN